MTPLAEAKDLLASAREQPQPAVERAAVLLEQGCDEETAATLHFALGMAHRTLANGDVSTRHLEAAAALAADDEMLGQILRSLAFNYAQAGDHTRGDETVAESISLLRGQERELSRLQQAFMLLMRGEHRSALPALTAAVAGFSASGDDDYLELTLYNRALVYMEFGDYDASVADLIRAYEIGTRLGHHVAAADAALHLSQVLGWRDDVPGAMRWHSRSIDLRTAAGAANPIAETEHAFVLIQARLLDEAETVLQSSLPRLVAAGGNHAIAVAGRLLLAEVLTEKGDYSGALVQVEAALKESPADGRWRFDIASAGNRIRLASGEVSTELLDAMLSTAADMERNGEIHPAAVERCRALPLALALGDEMAADDLGRAASASTRHGPLWLQIQAWTALAQLRLGRGNRRGSAAAVAAGMRRLDAYRAGIGATDLRIHAASLGAALASIGIDLAIESASLERVYVWEERLSNPFIRRHSTTPQMTSALAGLRRANARHRAADQREVKTTLAQLATAERRVAEVARQETGATDHEAAIGLPQIRDALGERTIVVYSTSSTGIHAITACAASQQLISLGPADRIGELLDHLRFAAERIARPTSSDGSRLAAISSATEMSTELRELLLQPLLLGAGRLVIIPSGLLHAVPWNLISDRPVEISPSASAWWHAQRRTPSPGPALVAHGSGLAHAAQEAATIAAATGAQIVDSVAETIRLLPSVAHAHFACHARPRGDNPMFSSIVLGDGELTLHDIERLDNVPTTVVMATCSGGQTVMATAHEVVSLAGAFLNLGARTVVAPLFTVSDAATFEVMRHVQNAIETDVDPATALAALKSAEDPVVAFTAGSFVCFGAC